MGDFMVMRWEPEGKIEDLRNHPAEAVMSLRNLLSNGAKVTPDPKRSGFYEVESGSLIYYIYSSPTTEKILLLATWPNESVLASCCTAA
jgi:hypothetical protein